MTISNNGGAASASWTLHYSVSKTTDSRNGRVGPYTTQDEADAAADSARDAAIAELQGEAQRMVDNAVASAKAELANVKFRYEEVGVPYGLKCIGAATAATRPFLYRPIQTMPI